MNKLLANNYQKNSAKFGWGIKNELPEYKIKELLSLIKGKKVLDVGCGPGHLVDILSNNNFQAFGIDITSNFIEYAKINKKGGFQIGTAENLPFKNKAFDTVILKSVIEHLKNDTIALTEALRVGKRVIIIVPQKAPKILKNKGLLYSHYQDKSHLRTYTKKSLKRLILKSNGSLIKLIQIEKLPNMSIFFELFSAPYIIKKIITKLFFMVFKEKQYYLELLAIIESC